MKKTVIDKPVYDIYETPVLIICFNRPQYIEAQLEALRLVKPSRIFISCDAARLGNSEDEYKVKAVQQGYEKGIDWNCELKTNYSHSNLGCSLGPINAMTWFFSEVDEGIILEDDIIPNKDFFDFMKITLSHYRAHKQIMSISGCTLGYNLNSNNIFTSKIMNMWGWATWSDRFKQVDFSINSWKTKRNKNWYLHTRLNKTILDFDKNWVAHWRRIFDKTILADTITWWDYQFIYNQLESKKLTIYPSVNLIKNVGFESDATHTLEKDHFISKLKKNELNWPLDISLRSPDDTFYNDYIKKVWSFYNRPNWKYYIGELLKKLGIK